MVFLESTSWDKLESVSITLTFLVSSLTLFVIYREYKKHQEDYKRKVEIEEIDLYLKIKSGFLTTESKLLMYSILEDNIQLVEIKKDFKVLTRKDKKGEDEILQIDLLQRVEDLYFFISKNKISIELIDQGFGSTIIGLYKNKVIQEFIEYVKRDDPKIYTEFKKLYYLIKEYNNE